MMDPRYAAYGTVGKVKGTQAPATARPALPVLAGCLLVPWLLFVTTFYLRSFELRREYEDMANLFCYCLLLPVLAFAWMTFNLLGQGDPKPMAFLTITSLLAWIVGFATGNSNYNSFMRPFYDINDLNVYPSVDAGKYQGNQFMDAGMIQFKHGSALQLDKSVGFKNGDVYCVAPIVADRSGNQSTHDFWAVGVNCCSAHMSNFACGEYTNPNARWGLRLMDESKREMFRLAVLEASAAFNLKAEHPVFLYWLSDPTAEVNAYQDDGFKFFMMFVFGAFGVQLFLVLCGALLHPKV